MGLSERRLAAALVALTLVAIVVAWWLVSALTVASEEVVSPGTIISESGDIQSAQSGTSQPGISIVQHPSGEGERPPSPPTNGNVAPVETPAPPLPPTISTPVPIPIVPIPPIDLDDDSYGDNIDDADDDRDND